LGRGKNCFVNTLKRCSLQLFRFGKNEEGGGIGRAEEAKSEAEQGWEYREIIILNKGV